MTITRIFQSLFAALAVLVVVAFTPLAEGREGTWQDVVGDIVWGGIFLVAGLIVVFGVITVARRVSHPSA